MPTGDWIQTYTGRKFYPMDPNPDDVCIEDIAHALSNVCRFNGHCSRFLSVAEHSLLVASVLPQPLKKWGLMHDAAEAYVSDLTTPVKQSLEMLWTDIEAEVLRAVFKRFGLDYPAPPEVKKADIEVLLAERNALFGHAIPWGLDASFKPAKVSVVNMLPHLAEQAFLMEWDGLNGVSVKERKPLGWDGDREVREKY